MTQFTIELLNFLAQKQDIDEFFRTSLETAMNDLLQAELSAFLGYEPYEKVGYNSGNSRNGTYLPLRRETVSKECIHIALGITPEGQKAVLGYEIAPNENNASWSTLLDKLQNQGIQQVSLVVTDGFKALEQIISQAYPFPNEEALGRYLVTLLEDYNFKQSQRNHKGFGQCSDTLESLFA
ncbi:transposase [Streptococcus intermedius]|nr:transposase [Streptococcus intermedius]